MENWREYITITTGIRSGKPCIKGTRITVGDILRKLASDISIDELIEDFPELSRESIFAALLFSSHKEDATQTLIAI